MISEHENTAAEVSVNGWFSPRIFGGFSEHINGAADHAGAAGFK